MALRSLCLTSMDSDYTTSSVLEVKGNDGTLQGWAFSGSGDLGRNTQRRERGAPGDGLVQHGVQRGGVVSPGLKTVWFSNRSAAAA